MMTQNHILKQRVENLKEHQSSAYSGSPNGGAGQSEQFYQLQNQQLEMQLNNMRDYYDRELENKDHALRLKEQEI
jgi:LPS sulfotransferase NodH